MQTTGNIQNRLSDIRRSRGIGAADLAKRVGVSRQTVYAIESGTYVPNTEVALKLARELEVTVEELFALTPPEPSAPGEPLFTDLLSSSPVPSGQAVRVCSISPGRYVSAPADAAPYFLPEADGIVSRHGRRTELAVLSDEDFTRRLVIAGCDPAISLLARMVERLSGIEVVTAPASSRLALNWLKQGKIHIAGTHLKDFKSGEFNLSAIRREFPEEAHTVVTFANWEEGFVVAPGNPKGVDGIADLARTRGKVRFINREPGSGARALLDSQLTDAGIAADSIHGYKTLARGHLAAAWAVHSGQADCCLATASAARTFGLDFIPVQSERYDFAIPGRLLDLPAVQHLLDALQRAALRRKLELLAGYDTSHTGEIVN